jgi:hypothetical protein
VTPDPKWLEILKASGWQTTGLACAFGVFLLLPRFGLLPPQEPLVTSFATIAFLVCGFLGLASIGNAANELFRPRVWFVRWFDHRQHKRRVLEYIPHMTEHEREIIAYLLAKNQKMITADRDGGYANTLISRGMLVMVARPGQVLDASDVPFAVPDHVWKVFSAHKESFPYKPVNRRDGVEPHPWRVPWMAR